MAHDKERHVATKTDTNLAKLIGEGIKASSYSNRRLAPILGVTHTAVGNWAKGIDLPSSWRIDPLALLLDIDADELWDAYRDAVRATHPAAATLPEAFRGSSVGRALDC